MSLSKNKSLDATSDVRLRCGLMNLGDRLYAVPVRTLKAARIETISFST